MSAGLYLHIPFCASKCAYCDFCSRPSGDDVKRAYVSALINEIEYMSSKFEGEIDTVYVGGGTPSCLPRGEFARLAGAVFSCFDCEVSEFTAEANPESFDESKADEYERSGVTRVSLGVQSTDNGILRFLGRAHDFEAAKRAAHIAARRFDLSLDQMLWLPGQTEGQLEEFVAFADSVGAAHLSSYILKVEDGTELAKRVKDGLVLPDDDRCADLYDSFVAAAAKRGYLRYETSNFAREGKRCRHNLKYWRMDDYLGLGVSAHGKIGAKRYFVAPDVDAYIRRAEKGEFVYEREELLTPESAADEYVMTALRLDDGIDIADLERKTGVDFATRYGERLKKLSACLYISQDCVAIKPEYALVANAIIAELI